MSPCPCLDRLQAEEQLQAATTARESALEATQRKLGLERALLRSVVDSVPDLIFYKDARGRYLGCNGAFARFVGLHADDVRGKSDFELFPREVAEFFREQDLGVMKHQESRSNEEWVSHADGRRMLLDTLKTPFICGDGEVCGLIGISRDITARHWAEQQHVRLATVAEETDNLVVITDFEGRIEWVNRAFERTTGWSLAEIAGQRPGAFLHGAKTDPDTVDRIRRAMRRGRPIQARLVNYGKDGREFWVELNIKPIHDEEGALVEFIAIQTDVTRRLERSEELRRAKESAEAANRAKSAFLAHMSHEIRTPLNVVLGCAQLLARDPGLARDQRQYLEMIDRSGEHLLGLINDVLEMSKIEQGRLTLHETPFELRAFVESLRGMFSLRARNKGIELLFARQPEEPRHVRADQGKLRQVLVNLIGNAIEFTARGRVTVAVELESTGDVGSQLRVRVSDTGSGISRNEQALVFAPFEQSESGRSSGKGTGLGLAISREFVRLMGGELRLESELGRGSTFEFSVTVAAAEAPSPARARPVLRLSADCAPPRVLVVDDVEDNRSLLKALLTEVGMAVVEAADGLEALERFDTEAPDLVLLDMAMPVMNGYDVARAIRAREAALAEPRHTPVVAVTASAFESDRCAVLGAGADDFLRKPIDAITLLAVVASHLGLDGGSVPPEPDPAEPGALPLGELRQLAELPPQLRCTLHRAATSADLDALEEAIDGATGLAPAVRATLRQLADDYAYDELAGALGVA